MQTGLVIAIFALLLFAIGIVMKRKVHGDVGEAFTVTDDEHLCRYSKKHTSQI